MRRTADCGVRGGFFDSGGSWNFADLVSALCGEYAVPADGGEATIVMHCIFILIQMALLRKDYDWVQLMQLPGGVRVRVHDGFRLLVHRGCALPELPYAGRLVPCGHRACGGRCGF